MQPAEWIGCGDFIPRTAPWEGHAHALSAQAAWLAAAMLLFAVHGAHTEPAAPFFARKTITITIGYSAGGSYDLYGRMIARHLGRHIPGAPTVIAQLLPKLFPFDPACVQSEHRAAIWRYCLYALHRDRNRAAEERHQDEAGNARQSRCGGGPTVGECFPCHSRRSNILLNLR